MAPTPSFAVRSTLLGAALATGAPVGWLAFQMFHGWPPIAAVAAEPELYAYLLVGPLIAFSCFGYWLGRRDDRISQENAKLWSQALTDPLTGLGNRRAFTQSLGEELNRAQRSRQPLSLVMLDFDRFKDVNDTFGHPVGDRVLQHAAAMVMANARGIDAVCRIGGEELAVLCPGATAARAGAVAERIRRAVAEHPYSADQGPVRLTVSAGVAALRPGETADDMVRRADAALYRAKAAGRDSVAIDPDPRSRKVA